MSLLPEHLFTALVLLEVLPIMFAHVDPVDLNHLPRDWKTGLLRYTPDLSKMTDDEIVKYRNIILKNPGHEKYCKPSGLPNNILWWHWRVPNWCRVEAEGSFWTVEEYEDLCCDGHGWCYCHYRNAHCECEV
ncbi:uncharacterized protein LOC131666210 [Phymastichus coffea]|uniref:uncharacterized protein LOC131666210 n=1 Tax=Phymastichus coffea TaxID=108790 RepID=UPI00273AC8B8|nr:uncharacterized protein LOC131666210 [Phymastichus coffea]XP_058794639.1 uncharacterized protein LOC131666210 [Phymastichus coffea]